MSLLSAKDADEYLKGTVTGLDQDLVVSHQSFYPVTSSFSEALCL